LSRLTFVTSINRVRLFSFLSWAIGIIKSIKNI
jgi:hypothetical protein